MTTSAFEKSYLTLSYHYLRQPPSIDPFPRVLGPDWNNFVDQVHMIQKNFNIISLADVLNFHENGTTLSPDKPNILFTFDDGLAEHLTAAEFLANEGIKAVFFIPTCLIKEKVPINAVILHHTIAHYGIGRFLEFFREAIVFYNLDSNAYDIHFEKGVDNAWKKIAEIKNIFKYQLSLADSEKVILRIYKKSLLQDFPDIFSTMHLTVDKMKKIAVLGHDIGSHSHSHVSLTGAQLSATDWQREVVDSKTILENTLSVPIESIAYPFGEKKDFADLDQKMKQAAIYRAGFIADEPALNTRDTSPFAIARYLPLKADTVEGLSDKLSSLLGGNTVDWRHQGLASTWKI